MRESIEGNISDEELIEICASNVLARVEISHKFIQLEIPSKVVYFILIRSQDTLDLNPREVAKDYFGFIEQGLTKTAAATVASSDYAGRGTENALCLIARNYHTIKSANGYSGRTLDFFSMQRYRKIAGYPEARLALLAISDFEEEIYKNGLSEED